MLRLGPGELAAYHHWTPTGIIVTQAEAETKESLAAEALIHVATQRPAWSRLGCLQLGEKNQRLPQDLKVSK